MANYVFKSAPIYYSGKKVAEVSSHDTSLDSGDEAQYGQEGLLGYSDGINEMTVEAQLVVPVQGISVTALGDMINKKNVTIGIPLEGKLVQCDMRVTNLKYSSDSKSGALKMSCTLHGAQPTTS